MKHALPLMQNRMRARRAKKAIAKTTKPRSSTPRGAGIATGLWRLADPKISITSAASMLIGASIAARDGELSWPWLAVTALAMFCVEVAKNAWGDIFDYNSGTDQAVRTEDRTDFSGGKRVLVDELLTRQQTWAIAVGFAVVGLALGALVVFLREPLAFWIGLLGFLLGWSYHGPPLQFAYHGLGELDVVICYGPLIALATYLIQTHAMSVDVSWLALPLGVLIAAFLWVNEFPDYEADLGAGKNNLIVRLGKHRASRVLPGLYVASFILLCLCPLITELPWSVCLGLIAAVPATYATYWCWRLPTSFHRCRAVQPAALIAFVLYSIATSIGLFID